jgi:hypothetical protein
MITDARLFANPDFWLSSGSATCGSLCRRPGLAFGFSLGRDAPPGDRAGRVRDRLAATVALARGGGTRRVRWRSSA